MADDSEKPASPFLKQIPLSLQTYGEKTYAMDYHNRKGFDPAQKEKMLVVTLGLLTALTEKNSVLLELGAGTGLFTKKIVGTRCFKEIHVTDGAPAMLETAQRELANYSQLEFHEIDFTKPWSQLFPLGTIDAVTSSMAFHHAENKFQVFQQVFEVLIPGGVLVFSDHMLGETAKVQYLIERERALIKLGRDAEQTTIDEFINEDTKSQAAEGNNCESVSNYVRDLSLAGFRDVDCIWRYFWLAVFVARKPL